MVEKEVSEDEINILNIFIVLLKHKRFIIVFTAAITILTAIISLILTPVYRAETRILPPVKNESGLAMQMLSQIGALSGIGEISGLKTSSDLYAGLLKSRTILDRIIDRFDLMKLYDVEFRDSARKRLEKSVNIKTDKKSGIVKISVEDKDRERSANMANAFVEELKNLTRGLAITEASQKMLFLEEKLKDAKEALVKSEEAMKGFQEKTGAIKIDDQAKAVIEGIAQLRAQIAAKEVELKVMKTYATPQNPDLQKTEEELKGLKEQLSRLEAKGVSGKSDPLIPTAKIPAVGAEYIRKLREFKYNEALYEILLKQYEVARIDAARDPIIIQVIDKAIPPEKRIKPKRGTMVVFGMITALFLSIFIAFLMEYKENLVRDPKNKEMLDSIKRYARFKRP